MDDTQVIILAAGQGSRLKSLTEFYPKSLITFGSEPLIVRTVRQMLELGFSSVRVVVGFQQEQIKQALGQFSDRTEFIYNEHYASDTNALSLSLGLQNIDSAALVIEADVIISNACCPIILDACTRKKSTWFSYGLFQPHQIGGVIKSDRDRKILDMCLLSQYDKKYADYSKNLGIVYIGPQEIKLYKTLLSKVIMNSRPGYYMECWIENLNQLACEEFNLFPHPAGSFNTVEELEYCRQLFFP